MTHNALRSILGPMTTGTSSYPEPEQAPRLVAGADESGQSERSRIRERIDLDVLRSRTVQRTRPWPSFDSGDPNFAADSGSGLTGAYER